MRTLARLAAAALATTVSAQGPIEIDLNARVAAPWPSSFVRLGDRAVFVAYGRTTGSEPWVTDGTSSGTLLLRDIAFAASSSDPTELARIGDEVWFAARSADEGVEPWRTDGTPEGTRLVADLGAAVGVGSGPRTFRAFRGGALFVASGGNAVGYELHWSDGTPEGTRLVSDVVPGFHGAEPDEIAVAGDVAYFAPRNSGVLWRTDGTRDGTSIVARVAPDGWEGITGLTALGDRVYFVASHAPWTSDGTPGGTRRLAAPAIASPFTAPLGSRLAFLGSEGSGWQLWATDLTDAGTVRLSAAEGGLWGRALIPCGSRVIAAGAGSGIWGSDGSASGTVRLLDASAAWTDPADGLHASGDDRCWFQVSDTSVGGTWVSDGTPEGTRALPGVATQSMGVAGSTLVFGVAEGPQHGPWRSDGTPEGTFRLVQLDNETFGSSPSGFVPFLGGVAFTADDGVHGLEPWITDGTPEGTRLLADVVPGAESSSAFSLTPLEERLAFFGVTDRDAQIVGLFVSDGEPPGTLVREFRSVGGLTSAGARWFFLVRDGDAFQPFTPWSSDGTPGGTRPLAGSEAASALLPAGDRVVIFGWDRETFACEVWGSDGSDALVRLPLDACGRQWSGSAGGRAWWSGSAWPSDLDAAVQRSDGTPEGSGPVVDESGVTVVSASAIADVQGVAHLVARRLGSETNAIFRDEGGGRLRRVADLPAGAILLGATECGAILIADGDGMPHVLDGGALRPLDAEPGRMPLTHGIAVSGGHAWFARGTGSWSREIWRTDGTPEGTLRVAIDRSWRSPDRAVPVGAAAEGVLAWEGGETPAEFPWVRSEPWALALDRDDDGVVDRLDGCALVHDPTQADADADGVGDACETPWGDVTGDGSLDIGDVVHVLRIAVGLETASPGDLLRGDVAPARQAPAGLEPCRLASGRIDVADVVILLRAAVGLSPLAPPR